MNSQPSCTPRIVILAAGFSRRLGKPKALARVHSVSLLRRTVMLLQPFAPTPLIVIVPPRSARYAVELRGLRARLAVNRDRSAGLSSSVRLGLALGRHSPAVLFVPVDLAGLESADLRRLVTRWRGSRRRVAARRVRARRVGAAGGAPLILPKWHFSAGARLEGDTGLRELLRGLSPSQRLLLDLPSAAADIDTVLDLSNARRLRPSYPTGFCTSR